MKEMNITDEPDEPKSCEIDADIYVGEAGNVPDWRKELPDDDDDEDDVSPDRLARVREVLGFDPDDLFDEDGEGDEPKRNKKGGQG